MVKFFDIKSFNPFTNDEDKKILRILRMHGLRRMEVALSGELGEKARSTALKWAIDSNIKSGTFIDLGCGDSADCLVMAKLGFDSYGLDVIAPSKEYEPDCGTFLNSDVSSRIPFPDRSIDIAVSQAMIDLIAPSARTRFLKEVYRTLKPGGIFSCLIVWLQTGYGFDYKEEIARARSVFPSIELKPAGYLATKGENNE